MKEIDKSYWPQTENTSDTTDLLKVLLNDKFLVQIRTHGSSVRLAINNISYTLVFGKPVWEDGITWDEIQEVKNQCGFEDLWACEYYPPKDEVCNIANIRHIWLLNKPPFNSIGCVDGVKQHVDKDKGPS